VSCPSVYILECILKCQVRQNHYLKKSLCRTEIDVLVCSHIYISACALGLCIYSRLCVCVLCYSVLLLFLIFCYTMVNEGDEHIMTKHPVGSYFWVTLYRAVDIKYAIPLWLRRSVQTDTICLYSTALMHFVH